MNKETSEQPHRIKTFHNGKLRFPQNLFEQTDNMWQQNLLHETVHKTYPKNDQIFVLETSECNKEVNKTWKKRKLTGPKGTMLYTTT